MRNLSTAGLNVYHGKEHIKTPSLVCRGDEAEQCARPRARRVHLEGSEKDRGVAQAFGRGKHAAERDAAPVRHVHAQLLHQPRWKAPRRLTERRPQACEGRASETLWPWLKRGERARIILMSQLPQHRRHIWCASLTGQVVTTS